MSIRRYLKSPHFWRGVREGTISAFAILGFCCAVVFVVDCLWRAFGGAP